MSIVTTSIEDRLKTVRARIDRGRAYAEDIFESLREREVVGAIVPAISRDEQLAAMLSRIRKVDISGVRFNEAAEGVSLSNGLPHHLQNPNQIG